MKYRSPMGPAQNPMVRILVAIACALPAMAYAHPTVDRAREAYGEGDFARAVELLTDLDSLGALTLSELQEALVTRALAQRAAGNLASLDRDLLLLASLGASPAMLEDAPPSVQSAYESLTSRAVRVSIAETHVLEGTTLRITASRAGDAGELVRGIRLQCVDESGRARVLENTEGGFHIELAGPLRFLVQAIGPGGATLAASEPVDVAPAGLAPVSLEVPQEPPASALEQPPSSVPEENRTSRRSPWLWVGVSAGVVAVAGSIVAAVLLSSDGGRVPFESPSVDFDP